MAMSATCELLLKGMSLSGRSAQHNGIHICWGPLLGKAAVPANTCLGGRFGYFHFLLLGEGEGGVRGVGRGEGRFFIENSQGGFPGGGGAEGAGRCLRQIGIGGGGAKYFFKAEMSTQLLPSSRLS